MNAGTDYARAKRQAQTNANQTRTTWRLFMYAGAWWIERAFYPYAAGLTVDANGAELIHPEQTEATS